jgi:cobalt-zinc-cadmium efflux system outer membrane protein
MRISGSAAIAFAAATVVCTYGHAAGRAEEQLSLEQALKRAEDRSPLVRRARLERGIADAKRVGAGVLLPANPAVAAGFGGRNDTSGSVPPANGFEYGLRLEQSIEIGGQRGARLAEASAGIRAADARVRLASVETRARARVAYLSALIAKAQAESARRREELGQRLYESARARVQAGAAYDVELRLAEVERGRLHADRVDAELGVGDTLAVLRLLLELPVDGPLVLSTPLALPAQVSSPLAPLLDLARARRAELKTLDEQRSQLDAAVVRLRREIVPNPTLYVDFARQQPGQTYLGGGLALSIPVWRRNQGELAQVRAERDLLDGEREIIERTIGVEVERALRTTVARRVEAELWEREIVPAAEATVELVQQGWRAGKFDLFRVIQASRDAGEARRRQLELLGALWQASIELDRATGTP